MPELMPATTRRPRAEAPPKPSEQRPVTGRNRRVRGLTRGLAVLRALNETNYATALQLSRATGLPRPTVYRLLETLIAAGYVAHGPRADNYRLTIAVRALSDGFDDEAWVTEIAAPILTDLGQAIVWPTDMATFDRDAMVVRETTHARSPLSINREKAGFRPPVLLTALGLAYLAELGEGERETILNTLAASERPDAALARNRRAVASLIAEVKRRGYGFREGGISPKTGSIAVPVMWRGRPLACINIHYILSAISMEHVVERYLPAMRAAAAKIEKALDQRGGPESAQVSGGKGKR
ncbi:MAG: helix-turn-helix domain-containing protein [Rhodospirillaceae bacterium]|nr:helix-turn-helix domain-containing protein [Rhodospirillaceae bacterium]